MTAPFYLVRHTETAWNRAGLIQGQADSPLTVRGFAQARAIAKRLLQEPVDWTQARLSCSSLFRARQTAAILCDEMGLDYGAVRFDGRLRERAYGVWQGLSETTIQARYPSQWTAAQADPWSYAVPDGESMADLAKRVSAWLAETPTGKTMLVIAHHGVATVFLGLYLGLSPAETLFQHQARGMAFRLSAGKVDPLEVAETAV